MSSIIGIITIIIYICQLFISMDKQKFNKHPFTEYTDIQKQKTAKLATFLWKLTFFLVTAIFLVTSSYEIFIFYNPIKIQILRKLYLYNLIIVIISIIIKEVFLNIIIFKNMFITFFKSHSPTENHLLNLLVMNILLLSLMVSIAIMTQTEKTIWICDIISVCTLALSSNFYRFISEAENLIYQHRVTHITIRMSDGTEYDKINYYYENKNTICVKISGNNTRYYLNKNQVIQIGKVVDSKTIMDMILKD